MACVVSASAPASGAAVLLCWLSLEAAAAMGGGASGACVSCLFVSLAGAVTPHTCCGRRVLCGGAQCMKEPHLMVQGFMLHDPPATVAEQIVLGCCYKC
jgi:hypothetical protein